MTDVLTIRGYLVTTKYKEDEDQVFSIARFGSQNTVDSTAYMHYNVLTFLPFLLTLKFLPFAFVAWQEEESFPYCLLPFLLLNQNG